VDSPYPRLARFKVSGLWNGDKIAIFRDSNAGTGFGKNWVIHSPSVKVDYVSADSHAAEFAEGRLPPYAHNPYIKFYPFGSMQRKTPVSEVHWLNSVLETLNRIMRNQLGASIIRLISSDLVIFPYVRSSQGAVGRINYVCFSPQDFPASYKPGQNADEA